MHLIFVYDAVPATTGYYLLYVISGGGVVGASTLTVYNIGGSGTIDAASIVYITSAGIIWTDGDRDTFPNAGSGPGAFAGSNNMATVIDTYCRTSGLWSTNLIAEDGYLVTNEDPNYAIEIATAITDIGIINAGITAWLTAGAAGPNGMWNDSQLNIFGPLVIQRVADIIIRITELVAAMGSVTDNVDGTYSIVVGALASRYQNLDRKINKSYGSGAQALNMGSTKTIIDQQKSNSEGALADYSLVMAAVALTIDGTGGKTIQIDDITGFVAGDSVYVVDEVQAELSGIVLWTYDDGRVDLDFEVSINYTKDNLARLYKVL